MVSILILLEVLLQPKVVMIFYFFSNSLFQSLFYWKFYFNWMTSWEYQECQLVSILILLEVLLQLDEVDIFIIAFNILFQSLFYWKFYFNYPPTLYPSTSTWCFNPYFTGSSTSTSRMALHRGVWSHVSILILLEVLLQPALGSVIAYKYVVFQSLFYWKFYFNSTYTDPSILRDSCFNPYFTGSSTSTFR